MQARAPAGAPPGLIAPDAPAANPVISPTTPPPSAISTVDGQRASNRCLARPHQTNQENIGRNLYIFRRVVFANSKSIYIICEDSCYLPTQHGARAVDL